jgi:hypothetical protein
MRPHGAKRATDVAGAVGRGAAISRWCIYQPGRPSPKAEALAPLGETEHASGTRPRPGVPLAMRTVHDLGNARSNTAYNT